MIPPTPGKSVSTFGLLVNYGGRGHAIKPWHHRAAPITYFYGKAANEQKSRLVSKHLFFKMKLINH